MKNTFKNTEKKLQQFSKKYYKSELIKGIILFFSLGFLYLFFTLYIEYFLWLKPTSRTFLFWTFVFVESFLLVKFIGIPILKLSGLRKGISDKEASIIIGNHFPEVADKLLNILQLKENRQQSDLLVASINQKSAELQSIPFVKAINLRENKKYIKYTIFPFVILVITLFTGNNGVFTESLQRVVNYSSSYTPPAPFLFVLENPNLNVIQGKSLTVNFFTEGNIVPNEAKISIDNQVHYLQNNGGGKFSYTFRNIQESNKFYIEANSIQSIEYQINVVKTPVINSISIALDYPDYTQKKDEVISNTGNTTVLEGTKITWQVQTFQTDSISFLTSNKNDFFSRVDDNTFEFFKQIKTPFSYEISSSNANLKNYEKLQFNINVVKDEFPIITIQSNIDSISRGIAEFAGQISDDYGLNKLELVYYNQENSSKKESLKLPITKQNIQNFFYQFPEGLQLVEGINYEFYFQVFDNDLVNGNKKTKSKIFSYRQKTAEEIDEALMNEQRNTINSLESTIQKQQKEQKDLETIQKEIQNKKNINWNDKKKIDKLIERQQQYNKMMQRQSNELQKNLDEKKEDNINLQEQKETLKKRLEELKKLDKQQKLLDEIQKMAEKLNKEDLVQKAKELAQQNKQQERSLTRTLELVKRFYVEQKTMQIANKLQELSKKQEELSKKEDATQNEQKEISKEFDEIKQELEELSKDNENLKEPMELPDVDDEKEDIEKELQKSEESLQKNKSSEAKKNQNNASKKMKQMSQKMQQSMLEMQGDSVKENIEDLRKILENLITFSYKQENLMNKFSTANTSHPDFGKNLKKQNDIRTYFEHIDDSLYVLSMRLPKLSTKIQDDLSSAHYNLEQSLENFSENRFENGLSNQRYVMTAANNLSDYLSSMLTNMKNSMSMSMGKGKPKKGGFSLPDIIKKQGDLSEKMKEGMKKGGKQGNKKEGKKSENSKSGKNGKQGKEGKKGASGKANSSGEKGENQGSKPGNGTSNNDLDGELFEIYKQQSLLRQQLQNAIKESEKGSGEGGSNNNAKKVLKTMEELENEILEKGFNAGTLQKMQNLNYELLKLDKAALEQGKDKKRKSTSNQKQYPKSSIKAIQLKKQFYNQTEILNRQSLPLQQNYKEKVRTYFSND